MHGSPFLTTADLIPSCFQPSKMFELLYNKINTIVPISKEEFEYFKASFVPKRLKKRQYFLQEGDVCKYQAFVQKGIMRSYTIDEKGNEHVLQFASEGWWAADL